ncbi:uncharacterized protein N7483_001634 [Penicillium malachiteum]|uniref:uncharacterized protein n=1 Tax=Penicillium malachiteum TaxID=1324776 RepID=UPI002549B220|nr:uncharacterized protein N7483_001634 [Penicillium malachiteum]KAJ5736509.1 hypothetical protein N7483_001634 [Penicillium malachiteum]
MDFKIDDGILSRFNSGPILKNLYDLVHSEQEYTSCFFKSNDLKALGVESSPVKISDGELQFELCFFKPHPEKLFQKYTVDPPVPEYQDCLAKPCKTSDEYIKEEQEGKCRIGENRGEDEFDWRGFKWPGANIPILPRRLGTIDLTQFGKTLMRI